MIRIGLIAEGEAELGNSVPYRPQDGGKPIEREAEGALHTLVRRELQSIGIDECQFVFRHPNSKEFRKGQVRVGYSVANRKYLAQVVSVWKPDEVDMIAVLVDADDVIEQRQLLIANALETIRENHIDASDKLIANQSVGGLAIKTFDTWLLADSAAIAELLDVALPNDLPENLETLTSEKDNPKHAKIVFDEAVAASDFESELNPNGREMKARWGVAALIDLNEIRRRCPEGYVPFMDEIQAVVESISAE